MARHAEGWKLRRNRSNYHVRFTYQGHRYDISTRESDQGRARKRAEEIYAETVSGRRRVERWSSGAPLVDILGSWLDAYEASHDKRWAHEIMIVARREWLPRWDRLAQITNATVGDYVRDRLREVSRASVLKELSALRQFISWCLEQGLIGAAVAIETPQKRALGKVRPKRRREPMTEERAREVIASLPVRARRAYSGPRPHRVRDYFIVLWETGLRPVTVSRLRWPDHFDGQRLHIPAELDKGRYARDFPLTVRALRALRRSMPKSPGLIFGRHDYRSYLPKGVSPYAFRHSRLTSLVEAGSPLPGVQYVAGHASLSTTAKYVHPTERAARVALGLEEEE